ncbi:MAG: hypothetical protein AMJ88_12565 [Anaerolineae bacterium SM23_ 63]|nr:MAG: hypothetical protein AMJ88_12565 [Anaerolineae bacterium SM23_ 63]HEY46099.1 hypothetical protein [Anaerolineae bacterium]
MNARKMFILLIGLAWPFLGLGLMALHFGYLPSGATLVAEAIGLLLAGILSGCLFMAAHTGLNSPLGRGMIHLGYLLFAPLGLMAALVAPNSLEAASNISMLTLVVGVPIAIVLYSNLVVAAGLGITGGLAISAKVIASKF